MDLTKPDAIRDVIREVRPNLIVNAAAYTAVDKAEADPDSAMAINSVALGIMAEEAKKTKRRNCSLFYRPCIRWNESRALL